MSLYYSNSLEISGTRAVFALVLETYLYGLEFFVILASSKRIM